MTREVVPGRGFTSPGAARVVEVTDVRACLAFGWVCSVTSWQAPNKTPVCVCVTPKYFKQIYSVRWVASHLYSSVGTARMFEIGICPMAAVPPSL